MSSPPLTEDQIRSVLEIRQLLAGLIGAPVEAIGPATRLRADLDMDRFEIRDLRIEILEKTSIWLPFDPAGEHSVLGIGLMLAEARP